MLAREIRVVVVARETVDIRASADDVFDLVHDYSRRLDWDSFLREASLCDGALEAGVGVSAYCAARRAIGGLGMRTVYVTFNRPRVAAVRMTRGPAVFASFAASIRQEQLDGETTRVTYIYRLRVRPGVVRRWLEPLVGWVFRRETRQRLRSLKAYLERHGDDDRET